MSAGFSPIDRDDDQRRNDDADGPLHQEAKTEAERGKNHKLARRSLLFERAYERRPYRQRDAEGERQIGKRHPSDREVAEVGRDDRRRQQARGLVVPPASASRGHEHQAHAGQRRPQARPQFGRAGGEIRRRRQPVIENRFLKPRLVVVIRGDPVARRDHFPGGFRIERFVGIGDGATPEAREECQRREQEQRKRDAMHFCYTTGSFGRYCFRSLSRTRSALSIRL
jgi:hypothetical protein